MALYLQTNVQSMIAENYFNQSNAAIQSSFTQLSSGYRINSAADDAAGLGIATNLNAQVQSYTIASQNTNDAISMVQTADGSADQIDSLLTRMRQLAVEAQNGTMSTNDQSNLNTEYQQDLGEIDRVAGDATFNGTSLLSGAANTVNWPRRERHHGDQRQPDVDHRRCHPDPEHDARGLRRRDRSPAGRLERHQLDADQPELGPQRRPGHGRRFRDRRSRPRAGARPGRRVGPFAG
jgi:hypothetical protein